MEKHIRVYKKGRVTNRAVLAKDRQRHIVKRGDGGPGVYQEEEEKGGI